MDVAARRRAHGALAFVLFRRLFGPGPALLAVPIILTSAVFATYAITAKTDVPFVLLCLIVLIALIGPGPHGGMVILSGVLCSRPAWADIDSRRRRRARPRAGPACPGAAGWTTVGHALFQNVAAADSTAR